MALPIIFAHRGASGYYPENTMLAFTKAVEMGATGIETDVHMTKDGKLVLIHDHSLERTCGVRGLIKDFYLEEIKQMDAGSWMDEDYKGERVPTLDELFAFVKQLDLVINLELKSGVVLYPKIEKRVVEAIRAHDMTERVIISSFNHYSLVELKRLAPEIPIGLLYNEALFEPWHYAKSIGASALHPIHYAVLPEFVRAAKREGIAYYPFTVNDRNEMKCLLQSGVSGIITDYPDRLADLLKEKSELCRPCSPEI